MNIQEVFVRNGYISIDAANTVIDTDEQRVALGTVLSNFASLGFLPSENALGALRTLSADDLKIFWTENKKTMRHVSGDDRNMQRFVVYKNFPKEVLEMDEASYWVRQILIYFGFPCEWMAEKPKRRKSLNSTDELRQLKVLELADENTEANVWHDLVVCPAKWTDPQQACAAFLFKHLDVQTVDYDVFGFKANATLAASWAVKAGATVLTKTATDVLRLAAAMSDGDIELRSNFRFRKFSRPERRFLLDMLLRVSNIADDFALRREPWKRLLSFLHPGEWKAYGAVSEAYDRLYRNDIATYAAVVEHGLRVKDEAVLNVLMTRPGDFMRRLHKVYAVFGASAASAFVDVLPKLTTGQLLKIKGYLRTINERSTLVYPPSGNWQYAKVFENKKVKFDADHISFLMGAINVTLGDRLAERFPNGVALGEGLERIKMQANDQELENYGRGTVFDIPEDVKFIRTASYWQNQTSEGTVWFDNGWNFFKDGWKEAGACCWTREKKHSGGAVFSGDPVNISDLKGRACQMIDLYPEKLVAKGVRYAVWSVLCYSRVPFNRAYEVLATLQWGTDPQKGKLYEPSRAQMVFPLKGERLTKFVAYIDLVERKLVYLDLDVNASVSTAEQNCDRMASLMPPLVERIASQPSVQDLFETAPEGTVPVLYDDNGVHIANGEAYVFMRSNGANTFEEVSLNDILSTAA